MRGEAVRVRVWGCVCERHSVFVCMWEKASLCVCARECVCVWETRVCVWVSLRGCCQASTCMRQELCVCAGRHRSEWEMVFFNVWIFVWACACLCCLVNDLCLRVRFWVRAILAYYGLKRKSLVWNIVYKHIVGDSGTNKIKLKVRLTHCNCIRTYKGLVGMVH
jgi:hypothetical protein